MLENRAALGGFIALVILMSAGAAQGLSGANTVYTDDIVDGQVTYADIRDNAVTGKKILGNSITGADVNEGSLRFAARRVHTEVSVGAFTTSSVIRECPAGTRLVSAVAHWGPDSGFVSNAVMPQVLYLPDRSGARVWFSTGSTSSQVLSVDLICASLF